MATKSRTGKSRTVKPRQVHVPDVPAGASWIESDSYDRASWREIVRGASTIDELIEAGERLVPDFASLLQDLFLALFKYNVVWQRPDEVRRSAALNRIILSRLLPSVSFEALKTRTLLEDDKAAIAALAMGEQVIEMVRSERLINRREMLDLWDLKHQEDDLATRAEALKNALEMNREEKPKEERPEEGEKPTNQASGTEEVSGQNGDFKRKIEQLAAAAERAAQVSEARLNQKVRQVEDQLRHSDLTELKRIELSAGELVEKIDRVEQDTRDFSLEFGQGARLSAGERLELGKRLARNRKLGELARMVGRFKLDARALRRKTLSHGAAEAYDIERGSEIGRLIPAELLALHHPGLAADFRRRLLEGEVLQYRLRDQEQKGKGPMVVCVDVSSSMAGDKELWAKAVSLTLMDIARRQRRLVRAVLFSSGENTLRVLDLNRERRYQPELAKLMELAEYFPGGGTDFERPLNAAFELIERKDLKRADIVIITDGEAQVTPEWLARLRDLKQRLKFKIFAVAVDVGSSELSTLVQIADKVTSVKNLTAGSTREIFLEI
jgi:uncharacterized protein with von Willebrand factor type A (vWA) domain